MSRDPDNSGTGCVLAMVFCAFLWCVIFGTLAFVMTRCNG